MEVVELVFENASVVSWWWQTWGGERISRPELFRRCALICARGVPRGTQLDPVCTAAAVVMAGYPGFDRAPAVRAALAPFYAAYPLPCYDRDTAVAVFLRLAAELDEQAAARLAGMIEDAVEWPLEPG